jgi:hypothetical protein
VLEDWRRDSKWHCYLPLAHSTSRTTCEARLIREFTDNE